MVAEPADSPVADPQTKFSPDLPAMTLTSSESRHDPFPLTDVQTAYWLGRGSTFELGRVACHLYRELDVTDLDLPRLEKAVNRLIVRHEMLRAVILPDGTQKILESVPDYRIQSRDLRDNQAGLLAIREEMSHQVLPADRAPLFEIRASRVDGRHTRLHVSVDALIADAPSLRIMAAELFELYRNPAAALAELNYSFRQYVLAERSRRDTPEHHAALAYWDKRLHELAPAPDLPLARNPGSISMPRFNHRSHRIEPATWQALRGRARESGLSPSAALCAAYAEILARWSKSQRFTLNFTLFDRLALHPRVGELIGDFTSLTLLEADLSGRDGFEAHAQRLQKQLDQDLQHAQVNGLEVMRRSAQKLSRRLQVPVVFTSLLDLPASADWSAFGTVVFDSYQTPQVWLSQTVREDPNGGGLLIEWDSVDELFAAGMIDEMFAALGRLVNELAAGRDAWRRPDAVVLTEDHLRARDQANQTAGPVPDGLLHSGFLEQAQTHPDRPAVISKSGRLTYGELAKISSRLAGLVHARGAKPNTLVGVVMEKGWEQVAAVLGILQAGAAYLPIDADLPRERLHQLLKQGEARIVLTQPWVESKTEWPEGVERIVVDAADEPGAKALPLPAAKPGDIAYVIFTSGSTGVPKGVVIDHRGALNTICDVNRRFKVGPNDRTLALSALNFDLSVYDIFGMLAVGGAIVLPEPGASRDPARWLHLLKEEKVTIWDSVPALMEMATTFAEEQRLPISESLRVVWMSGDWIPVTLPDRIRKLRPGIELISMGGATEASIWSILYPIGRIDPAWKSVPYGKAMVNQQFHVLDSQLRPSPTWVPGTLFIGGIGVAKGYWKDEEKTNASFITHPETGERIYRTGDMGCYWPDGNIEFLGREDTQVKISGFRIELGEIETNLLQHPDVKDAAVVAREDGGPKRLVAYAVARADRALDVQKLKEFLRAKLPEYMVPPQFVVLGAMPLSANGKVDRKALPAPDRAAKSTALRTAPRTPAEEALAAIWKEVLNVPEVGVHDNFLELGGSSLQAIQVQSRATKAFQVDLPLTALFEASTIEEMAALVERKLVEQLESMSDEEAQRLLDETTASS